MGYSNFKKLKTLSEKFNLDVEQTELFEDLPTVEPSAWLLETLQMAKIVPLLNEKVKTERIISPILVEVAQAFRDRVTLFSGEALDIDAKEDLAGECDFFFTLSRRSHFLKAPIISLAEAKNDNMEYGRAQCAAQLYGAKLFNEAENKNVPFLYGCATDGVEWQFMRFENNVFYIDTKIYTDLKEILGVWHYVISLYL